ncbi:MAG: acetylglutamate kinase [Chitinophagaceae bacterium]|nr:acetylglutamate kinase [Chitinophagaceae bacterium]
MDKLFIIKIGGHVLDDEQLLRQVLEDFSAIREFKILVHGGGKIATRIGEKLGIKSQYINGRRITDEQTLDLITMVYAGLINKKIVAALQALHCNAIGLTGADANLIPAQKREVKEVDFGWVGDIQSETIETRYWNLLLREGCVPVIAPVTHDKNGSLLNTNADTIAREIAVALSKTFQTSLIYLFEKNGVLWDIHDEHSVIPSINTGSYEKLKSGNKIFEGMLPKLENAFTALKSGVNKVMIGAANQLQSLIQQKTGTTITI